jgi:hypothetical protein
VYHKHEPSDRANILLYKLKAWVHFAGRRVQPAQPCRTRRTTGWQACTTATTRLILNKKKNFFFFIRNSSGCTGCTRLPAGCTSGSARLCRLYTPASKMYPGFQFIQQNVSAVARLVFVVHRLRRFQARTPQPSLARSLARSLPHIVTHSSSNKASLQGILILLNCFAELCTTVL